MSTDAILTNQVIQKAWQDPSFKAQLLANPKKAIQEALGVILPENIRVNAVEEKPDEFYLVLPPSPEKSLNKNTVMKNTWN
ncbi:NHLP leader peptide family natural product precursor [Paenibacillus zeisoli]|uniref:NHLP leader peptide family natural product n=1 Tax=Paenibacillus zeisoli TaxID=2496267 RepID=A0A3S1B511_9BACL|nr:NHLP leader peptide family RiPP precursor [Paenibacillus zeisoli]RUT30588.1 NHLP leader peptide family natural product precursor [Paenibacillus zeisoli]